jgi:hypothetical protein
MSPKVDNHSRYEMMITRCWLHYAIRRVGAVLDMTRWKKQSVVAGMVLAHAYDSGPSLMEQVHHSIPDLVERGSGNPALRVDCQLPMIPVDEGWEGDVAACRSLLMDPTCFEVLSRSISRGGQRTNRCMVSSSCHCSVQEKRARHEPGVRKTVHCIRIRDNDIGRWNLGLA